MQEMQTLFHHLVKTFDHKGELKMKHSNVVLSTSSLNLLNSGKSIVIRLPDVEITVTPEVAKKSHSIFDDYFDGLFSKLGKF